MSRQGLMDDTGYQFDEIECPESVDDFEICENCIRNGECDYQDQLIEAEEESCINEWNKLYNDTRF